ncbi:ribonuclease P protein component 2 [Candidatus Woesearchaeota archaeon]|nr:ribonuclease P protein component 2 [Candidatus Woesearchaeota archaeon]
MRAKTKPLRPSLREKKRYIVFEFVSEHKFNAHDVSYAITDACRKYIGEFGLAKAKIKFISNAYMPEKNRGIIRVANKAVEPVVASLVMITNIKGRRAAYHTIGKSGILKKAKNKFLTK